MWISYFRSLIHNYSSIKKQLGITKGFRVSSVASYHKHELLHTLTVTISCFLLSPWFISLASFLHKEVINVNTLIILVANRDSKTSGFLLVMIKNNSVALQGRDGLNL